MRKGREAFLESCEKSATFRAALDALSEPANFGRAALAVQACRGVKLASEEAASEDFLFDGDTPRAIANAAVDPSPANAGACPGNRLLLRANASGFVYSRVR